MDNQDESTDLNRRQMLKRGAAIGVATAWAVPVAQAIGVSPSHADTPSAPSGGGPNPPDNPRRTIPPRGQG